MRHKDCSRPEYKERITGLQNPTDPLTRLTQLAKTVSVSLDTQRVFEAVVEGAIKLLHVSSARLWVIDSSTEDVVLVATASDPGLPTTSDAVPTRLRKGQGLVGWVIDQRRLHHAPVGTEESLLEHAERANQVRLVSQLTVPLLRGDRTLGALVVLTPERREFSLEEQELLKTFARTAALAIDNARLYEEAQEALRAAKMADPR